MVAKKKILISLTEEEEDLLAYLMGEFSNKGLKVSQSALVGLALKNLKKEGGVVIKFKPKEKT